MMRLLTIEHFGVTKADDRHAVKISISNNNGMKIELLNYGATLHHVWVLNRDNIPCDVALAYDTLQEYESDRHNLNAIIGRVAGPIRYGKFAMDSKEYELGINAPPHHVDGGTRGSLSKKTWDYELLDEANGVCFSCRSHDGEEGYPGQVRLEVTYILTNKNEIIIDYRATTDKATILNIANNGVFNLDGQQETSSLYNHEVQLNTFKYLPKDENGMITGEINDVRGSCFDLTKPSKLLKGTDPRNDYPKFDQDFCLDLEQCFGPKTLRHVARVISQLSGIALSVYTTYPLIQFCTKTITNGCLGTENEKNCDERFAFALQCRGFSDAINQPKFPTVILRSDEHYQQMTIYQFSLI